jgi:hypothetical protein
MSGSRTIGSMPGPTKLEELTAYMRVPDPYGALNTLAREVVPGQTEVMDRIVAVAWATPDVERTMETAPLPFRRSARDRLLDGATAAVRYGPVALLLEQPLHPDEGRVAAFLSRYGEGVLALFLERPRYLPPSRAAARPPRAVRTPFGRRGWLLPHEWPWGPFVIALEQER